MPIAAFLRDHGPNKVYKPSNFLKVNVGGRLGRRDLSALLYCKFYNQLQHQLWIAEDRYCWSQTCSLNLHSSLAFNAN